MHNPERPQCRQPPEHGGRGPRALRRVAAMVLVAALGLQHGPRPVLAAESTAAAPGPEILRKWSRSCALCHVDGNAGAPRVGHPQEWQPRLAQCRDVLFEHTVQGFNKMPPLGYCMACDAEDFRALIDFMAGDEE